MKKQKASVKSLCKVPLRHFRESRGFMLAGRISKCLSSDSTEKKMICTNSQCVHFVVQKGSTSLIGFTKFKHEAMHKGNSNLHMHLSIYCVFYIPITQSSKNIKIDLS